MILFSAQKDLCRTNRNVTEDVITSAKLTNNQQKLSMVDLPTVIVFSDGGHTERITRS